MALRQVRAMAKDEILRPYVAVLGRPDEGATVEATVWAKSLDDARSRLEAEYGPGNVFYLRNLEGAARPRS